MTENVINNEDELQNIQERKVRPPQPYEGDVPFGYEEYFEIYYDEKGEHKVRQIREITYWTPEERISNRIEYLRIKLINGTITPEEREELKLLIG